MELTGKATPQSVKMAWSFSVTALCTIVEYRHLSGSSPNFWNGDDRKSDTSSCQEGLKCFSDSFIYECWTTSFVRISNDILKRRWQEKRRLNLSKSHEVFQWQLCVRLLNIVICQDLHRIFELEMTGKATPQFVKSSWSVSVTALYTIVEYHHLSGSSPNFWNGDDRKSDTSVCQEGMKCFSNSFTYDCCISSNVRIFMEYLKWRWQEKRQPKFVKSTWSVSVTALYTIVVYHQLSGSSSVIWNGDERKSDTSVRQKLLKYFSDSFIYDCWISSVVRIFIGFFEREMPGKTTLQFVKKAWSVSVTASYTIVVYHQLSGFSSIFWNGDDRKSDTSICQECMKCFSNSSTHDCCISWILRIFNKHLKWRWQEKRHLNLWNGMKCFSNSFI